ncbi:MAG: hypothetical protein RIQ52_759 [Pseudomonadota bacterium]
MYKNKLLKSGALALFVLFQAGLPSVSWAHGGASGVDTDSCRIQLGESSSDLVHFTAYQPQTSGTTEYCAALPEIGLTNIVFDYEGKGLRNMQVEFEITKEPEGTRVFYSPPKAYSTGTANSTVNFAEPGNYLVHVSFARDDQKVDAHIPFRVGTNQTDLSFGTKMAIATVLFALAYILYLANPKFQAIMDKLLLIKNKP